MKKCLFAALGALLVALPLSASTRPAPGQFGLKGEWIYFCPAIDDTYFVLQGNSSGGIGNDDNLSASFSGPQGDKYNNLFSYQSGYRLEGIYSFCNCINDLRLRWTQLLKKSHSEVVVSEPRSFSLLPTELPPSIGFPSPSYSGTAGSIISMEYYAAEAMLGQLIYDCSPFSFEFEVGIHYGHVKFNEELDYAGQEAPMGVIIPVFSDLKFEDTFNGLGPELAFDGDYALYNSDCCCPGTLYLTSSLRGAILIADSEAKFFSEGITGNVPQIPYAVTDKKSWRIVPWWDMKLGLNYTSSFNCFTVSLEAGYEAGSYINAISKERFTDNSMTGYSFNQFQNFTYHGPYVAAEAIF